MEWRDNPVFRRELLYRLRPQPSQRWVYVLMLALCLFAVGMVYLAALESVHGLASYWDLLTSTLVIEMFVVVAGAPAVTANAISREREQRTWDLLVITLLKPHEVVLGKLAARALPLLFVLVLGLPMVLLCVIAHPSLWLSALMGTLTVLVTLALYSAAGLVASALSRNTVTATATAYLFAGGWVFGTLILWGLTSLLFPRIDPRNAGAWLALNPFAVIEPTMRNFSSPTGHVVPQDGLIYMLSPWLLLVVYSGLTWFLVWTLVRTYQRWAFR